MMRRRQFIAVLGGVAAWPLAAQAQQPAVPVVGFLHSGSPENQSGNLSGFRQGLAELGFVEGQNLTIEFRWAQGRYDRLPALAADLVSHKVAVIDAETTPAALAAQAATKTIPIVFGVAADPVAIGLVTSLNRPGGNLTGGTAMNVELIRKKLEMLHELVPSATNIAFLVNPTSPNAEALITDAQMAALTWGLQLRVLTASSEGGLDAVFEGLVGHGSEALVVSTDPFLGTQSAKIIAFAERHRLPVMSNNRTQAAAGGLISYGTNFRDAYRQGGIYVGRILKGEKPADLPILQPTKFELVINLKTAKALGLTVPPSLLATADEVVE
jgi:putative ABC transport system substrate-binding protein